jgi:lysophospholipase L1-like esterase
MHHARSIRTMAILPILALSGAMNLANASDKPEPGQVRIVLVGDSTVTDAAGWGKAFAGLLKPGTACVNRARGGASSKSYYDAGLWKQALAQQPTHVLIQFGHNDQPGKGPERETDPRTTYRDNLRRYIDEARAAGVEPILVTSLVRRVFEKEGGKLRRDLEPYAEAARAVAEERKVPVVDLHARSKALIEQLGSEKAREFGPPHPKDASAVDKTHLSDAGAKAIAPLIAEDLRKAVPDLSEVLSPPKAGK